MEHGLQASGLGTKAWKLPKPRVCVMEAKRSRSVLGWHSAQRWKQGAVKLNEIVLTPKSVSRGIHCAAEVLAHELVHLANAVAKREDTSRQGRYHNKTFKLTAEAMGLIVAQDEVRGWAGTRLSQELNDYVRDLTQQGIIDVHVVKYQREADPVAQASLVKLTCACGVFAYVTRSHAGTTKLQCGECGEFLSQTVR
ncbi:hypothetical protein BH10PLA2_BH10PLA2_27150 [soil metagenome]